MRTLLRAKLSGDIPDGDVRGLWLLFII
jgi:hypothetical protein